MSLAPKLNTHKKSNPSRVIFSKYGMKIAYTLSMRVTFNSMDPQLLLLMDELQKKRGKSNKNSTNDLTLDKSTTPQLQPDWNRIPSKNVAMSEEEFEEAIKALALADAERGMKMSNAGKGILAGEMARSMLLTEYLSVVSPDRKGAYEKFNGKGDAVYGNFNQELLTRGTDGVWTNGYTKEESARYSKFNSIYINAIKEYEAEHGQIPYTEGMKSGGSNPYSEWATYNPKAYPGIYSVLA